MVLTIDRNQSVDLDDVQVSNLVSDLSDFGTLIDKTLRLCGEEPDKEQIELLLKRLNLLADIYS